jgi:hypothetical protein
MSSGWIVNVKDRATDDLTSSKTYYTRVSYRREAEQVLRDHLADPMHAIEARLPVQSSVVDSLGIPSAAPY